MSPAREIDSHIEAVDVGDQSHVLARHVAEAIHRALEVIRDAGVRVRLVNEVLGSLESARDGDLGVDQPSMLMAVLARGSAAGRVPGRPATPLSEAALLTNSAVSRTSAPNRVPNSIVLTRSTCCVRA